MPKYYRGVCHRCEKWGLLLSKLHICSVCRDADIAEELEFAAIEAAHLGQELNLAALEAELRAQH